MLKAQKEFSQKGNEGRRGEGKLSNSPALRQGMASRLQVWLVLHQGCQRSRDPKRFGV